MSRHHKMCNIYWQFMDASLRVAQYAELTNSIARKMASQVKQQEVGAEEEVTEWIQTCIVSFASIVFTQMVLTSRSPTLDKQTLTCLTQRHCFSLPLFLSPSLGCILPCQHCAVHNVAINYLRDFMTYYLNYPDLLL